MTLKFTNQERTTASFDNESFGLAAPEDWDSIGNGPTREAVKAWIAAGNAPDPADLPDFTTLRDAYFTGTVRPMREIIMNRLGNIASRLARQGDETTASACDAAVERLLGITTDTTVLAAIDMDGLKSAVLTYYWQTADSLPDEVKNAFNGIDA